MLPSDARQRALFLQIAAKGGSYNWAGKPWEGGIVKYCFAADIALHSRLAFEKGIEQYKKGVPCLQWVNVGLRTSSSSPVYDSYTYTVRGTEPPSCIARCLFRKPACCEAQCPQRNNTSRCRLPMVFQPNCRNHL